MDNFWRENVHFFLLLTLLVKFSSSQMLISKTHSNISLKVSGISMYNVLLYIDFSFFF